MMYFTHLTGRQTEGSMTTENWYHIGDKVKDEDGNEGIVVILWNDCDICHFLNDAAHPNPVRIPGGMNETQT
jgi:hypothetical protein